MKGQMETVLKGAGRVPPKWHTTLIEKGSLTLPRLLRDGMIVPAKVGKERATVTFQQVGEAFKARQGTGWMAVKVRSGFGGLSTLLLDVGTGEVSGILRLQR
jgi:hypothetical protein